MKNIFKLFSFSFIILPNLIIAQEVPSNYRFKSFEEKLELCKSGDPEYCAEVEKKAIKYWSKLCGGGPGYNDKHWIWMDKNEPVCDILADAIRFIISKHHAPEPK